MKKLFTFVLLSLLASAAFAGIPRQKEERMQLEADSFINAMPPGLQDGQSTAIERALRGDFSFLQKVRNARNARPEFSAVVKVSDFLIPGPADSIPARLFVPENAKGKLPLLLYFHGGGWTIGSINSCSRFCDALAATGKTIVLAIDYCLAPEHPYPEPLDDCRAAYGWTLANADNLGSASGLVSLGGDSSGGNLALAVAGTEGIAEPRSLVLFYPVTKAFADGSDSWNDYGSGYGLDSRLMDSFNRAYTSRLTEEERNIPAISPALGMCKLPPVLFVAAGRDILFDQGKEFCKGLRRRGTRLQREEFSGAVHLFITVPGQSAAFAEAVKLTANFLAR